MGVIVAEACAREVFLPKLRKAKGDVRKGVAKNVGREPVVVKEPKRKKQSAEDDLGKGENVWAEPAFVDWFIEVFGRSPSRRDSFAELVAASRRRSEGGVAAVLP